MVAPALAAAGRLAMQKAGKNAGQGIAKQSAQQAMSTLSANILRQAWLYIIPTFGLTLIYVNIHFIARYLAGSTRFVEFGSEWNPTGAAMGRSSFALKFAEIMLLIFLDAVVLFALLGTIVLIAIIAWAFAHPLDFLSAAGSSIACPLINLIGIPAPAAC